MTESPTSGKGVGTGFPSGPLMEHFRCPQPLAIMGHTSSCVMLMGALPGVGHSQLWLANWGN